jgi:hypothetical protein
MWEGELLSNAACQAGRVSVSIKVPKHQGLDASKGSVLKVWLIIMEAVTRRKQWVRYLICLHHLQL